MNNFFFFLGGGGGGGQNWMEATIWKGHCYLQYKYKMKTHIHFYLFDLILYVLVNIFSVMLRRVFMGLASMK